METKERVYPISNSLYGELTNDGVTDEILLAFASEISKLSNSDLSQVHNKYYSEDSLSFLAFEQNPYELELFNCIEYHSEGRKAYVMNNCLYDELVKDGIDEEVLLDFAYALSLHPNDFLFDEFGFGVFSVGQLSYLAHFNFIGEEEPEGYEEAVDIDPYCYLDGLKYYFWWPDLNMV